LSVRFVDFHFAEREQRRAPQREAPIYPKPQVEKPAWSIGTSAQVAALQCRSAGAFRHHHRPPEYPRCCDSQSLVQYSNVAYRNSKGCIRDRPNFRHRPSRGGLAEMTNRQLSSVVVDKAAVGITAHFDAAVAPHFEAIGPNPSNLAEAKRAPEAFACFVCL
jgi:hypothetical protein